MDPHAELDWPGVLRLAGRFCATERGRERMQATVPASDPAEVRRRLGVTTDLVTRRGVRPPVALGGLDEGAALLPRLGPAGRALDPEDLLDLFALVERAEGARLAVPVGELPLGDLTALLDPLHDFEDLLAERAVTFEPDGRIRDTATARLAAIRSSLVKLRRDVVSRLEEFARARADALSEGYVTEKGGRYCLPVRADRRDLVAGIVHEKSGSGQTLFVEPLAAVDANNALAEALEEEREEIRRILVALTARFSARRTELAAAVEVLLELDVAQAKAEWSTKAAGIVPETGELADGLVLKSARHPLLDRKLAALREEVFGETADRAATSDAVPLDIELPRGTRALLLSGPNAGGKSVAMKTVGLFALLAQSGFAVPAGPGTRLPVFDRVLVVAGDAQDLLGDLSSFAASMTRTARVLRDATSRSLVLLDELGSGTDPDEGGALAIAVLEHDLGRGGLTVATTHLSAVKEWAQSEPSVLSAAMEFDEKAGRPTFRVRPGSSGRSRALAVAERAGLPARVLSAAKRRLGDKWGAADAALARLEAETRAAEEEARKARDLTRRAEARVAELERERTALNAERVRLKEKGKLEIERALEAARERIRRELERVREETKAGRALSRGALTTITHAAREEALARLPEEEEPPSASGPLSLGELVRISPFRTTGRLLSIDHGRGEAEVEVGGKRMRVAASALSPVHAPAPQKPRAPAAKAVSSRGERDGSGPVSTAELVLVGQRVDDALRDLERALNDALMAGKGALRVVHGHGTGRLAAAVKEFLSEYPAVRSQRPGDDSEGGTAVTMAFLDT